MNPFKRFQNSKLLIFEGITGSGKSTQIKMINKVLQGELNYSLVL